jgi:hypothetical protein
MNNRWAKLLIGSRLRVALVAVIISSIAAGRVGFTSARFVDQESTRGVLQAIGNWYDFAWHWRAPIDLNNAGGSLTDYQLRISVNTALLVAAGKMQLTGADIRFTAGDGLTAISYWIESGMNTASTVLWVKIPSVPTGSSRIYMYYGNNTATAASSGDATFIFFDDFENGFAPGSKWSVINHGAGSVSLSTSSVFHGTNSLRVTDSPNGLNLGVSANFSPQTKCVIEYAVYFTLQGSKEIEILDPAGNIGPRGGFVKSKAGADTLQFYVTNWNDIGNFSAASWYQTKLVIPDVTTTADNYSLYFYGSSGNLLAQASNVRFYNGDDLSSLAKFVYVGTSDARTDTYIDLVKVRAYAATEPTYAMGNEQ